MSSQIVINRIKIVEYSVIYLITTKYIKHTHRVERLVFSQVHQLRRQLRGRVRDVRDLEPPHPVLDHRLHPEQDVVVDDWLPVLLFLHCERSAVKNLHLLKNRALARLTRA